MSTDDMPLSEKMRRSSVSKGTNHETRGDANRETREDREDRRNKERDLDEVRTNVAPNRKKKYLPSAPEVQEQMEAENKALDDLSRDILMDIGEELMEELKKQKVTPRGIKNIKARWEAQLIPRGHGREAHMEKAAGVGHATVTQTWLKYRHILDKFQEKLNDRLIQLPLYVKSHLARLTDAADIHSQTGPSSFKVLHEKMYPRHGIIINQGVLNQQFGGNQQINVTTPAVLLGKTPEELEDEITRIDRGEVIDVEAE